MSGESGIVAVTAGDIVESSCWSQWYHATGPIAHDVIAVYKMSMGFTVFADWLHFRRSYLPPLLLPTGEFYRLHIRCRYERYALPSRVELYRGEARD